MQFTHGGHTQLQDNAIMITSTITIVLFSTMVYTSCLCVDILCQLNHSCVKSRICKLFFFPQVFGLMTKPLISLLLPPQRQLSTVSSGANTPKSLTAPLLGSREDSEGDLNVPDLPHPPSLRMLLTAPSHKVHRYWRKFDDAFMRPMFGGRGFAPPAPRSPTEHGP